MLRIYHAANTRGIRVIWLAEELGLDYEVRTIDFSPAYRATPEWRAISPIGKLPVMEDGSIRMFESGAMVEYLLARYGDGRLAPQPDSIDYAEYLQWLWFAEATLARPLGEIVNHGREFPGNERIDAVVNEMAQRAGNCLTAVAEHLNGRRYLLGDTFSAADIMMGYSILIAELLVKQQIPEGLMPYWETLQQRPGFQTARGA